MLHRYAVDFPFQDDFVQLLAAPGYFHLYPTWREQIVDLFSLSVEHRIVTLRLAEIVQTRATKTQLCSLQCESMRAT